MARCVLTDASPLIGLARVDGLSWLSTLFGEVLVPVEVRCEVLTGRGSADESLILAAEAAGILKTLTNTAPDQPKLPDLDEGESACIRHALAAPGPILVLMDERAGRAIAMEHGLRIAGTAAVIGMAKKRGLIPSAREAFAQLHASDFRLSAEVIRTVLDQVGEY